jgi:PPM family protein phosphatase
MGIIRVSGHGLSDLGLKRSTNEDSFLSDSDLGLFMVCDGVSGHAAGDVASRMAVTIVHQHLKRHRTSIEKYASDETIQSREVVVKLIEQAINLACGEVFRLAEADENKRGMATTVTLFLRAGRHAIIAHVGDSRIYLARGERAYQLTEDHSLLAEELKRGALTPEEAERFKAANVITRAVGFQELVQVDSLHLELADGDTYVLCSDGLSDYFQNNELAQLVKEPEPSTITKALIDFAKSKGGKDNITAVVIRVIAEDQTEPNFTVAAKTDAIRKIPLFKYLTYQELMKVLNVATVNMYQPGDVIIKEDTVGTDMFILLGGSVKLLKLNQLVNVLRDGAFFGEMGLIDNAPRSASVVAEVPTRALVITRNEFYP